MIEQENKNKETKLNSMIALIVAITATFMAICNVKDGNIVQSMSQSQANSLDAWSYYQAKSTKEAIVLNTLDLIKMQHNPDSVKLFERYNNEIIKYSKEKEDILKQAKGFQKEYNDINLFDDQFDMTEALLTISIAMFGITSLTQNKKLFIFSTIVSISGIVLGLAAFFKISMHSDLISRILG